MNIGDYLRKCRKKKNLTLIQLSKMSNVSQSQLSKIERGEHTPSKETLIKLCSILELNIEQVFNMVGYTQVIDEKLNTLLNSIINSNMLQLSDSNQALKYSQSLPILTIEQYPGKEIEYVDFVTAEASNIKNLYESVNKRGLDLKADAIVGFRIEMNDIKPLTVVGYGTAIRFKN